MLRLNGLKLIHEIYEDAILRKIIMLVLSTSESDEDRIAAYDFNVSDYR